MNTHPLLIFMFASSESGYDAGRPGSWEVAISYKLPLGPLTPGILEPFIVN
jgi:hypothetical protein